MVRNSNEVWSRPFWGLFHLAKGRIHSFQNPIDPESTPLAPGLIPKIVLKSGGPAKDSHGIKWGGAARQLHWFPARNGGIHSYRWLAMCTCSVFYMFHVEWLPGDPVSDISLSCRSPWASTIDLPYRVLSQTWEQWPKSESTVVEHCSQSHWDWSWWWCRSTVRSSACSLVHQLRGEIAGAIPKSQQFLHGCVWKCCVPHCTQWFCWSLSLWKMASYHWEY